MADLFGEWELAQAQGLEGDLGEGVNLGGLPRRLPRNKNVNAGRQIQENAQEQQQERRRGGFATHNPMQAHYDGFIQQFGPQAQGNALQGAINQTMGAIQDENDSRVAQEREARRMEHEKEMEQMRQQALIQRLQMEHDQTMKAMAMRAQAEGLPVTRRYSPQSKSWEIV